MMRLYHAYIMWVREVAKNTSFTRNLRRLAVRVNCCCMRVVDTCLVILTGIGDGKLHTVNLYLCRHLSMLIKKSSLLSIRQEDGTDYEQIMRRTNAVYDSYIL